MAFSNGVNRSATGTTSTAFNSAAYSTLRDIGVPVVLGAILLDWGSVGVCCGCLLLEAGAEGNASDSGCWNLELYCEFLGSWFWS